MVYHILPEAEPFSESHGGALSRWVANTLRTDPYSLIITPWQDDTWNFDHRRVLALNGLRLLSASVQATKNRMPSPVRERAASLIFRKTFSAATSRDVVYVHNRPEYVRALLRAYPRRQFKILLHMHNSHLAEARHTPQADLNVFCSEFLEREAKQKFTPFRSAVIPNGADENCFYPASQPEQRAIPRILFVGRLVKDKGVDVLISAMKLLRERNIQAEARVVGSARFGDNAEDAYTRHVKALAPPNVVFSTYKVGSALGNEYRAADIFCCPSVFNEPFGMVNVEAMASRLPVVATEVGGVPEIFRHGGAMLVPPNNPSKLAEALATLIQQRDLRVALGRQGYSSFTNNFRWEVVRKRYDRTLESMHVE